MSYTAMPLGTDRTIRMTKLDLFVNIIPGLLAAIVVAVFQLTLGLIVAWAGPPFVTDDPEPVEYRHWEIYLVLLR